MTFPSLPSFHGVDSNFFPCSLFSFLPPSTTLRKYQRSALATATGELGAIYCSIVSFANTGEHTDADTQEIVQSLIAIRAKLKRSLVLKQNIVFEVRWCRLWGGGGWVCRVTDVFPVVLLERKVACGALSEDSGHPAVSWLNSQLSFETFRLTVLGHRKIANHLSYLMAVVAQFEPAWSQAFLRRCRFLDSEFQGETLAVISERACGGPLLSCLMRSRYNFHCVEEWHSNPADHTLPVIGSIP